MKAFILLMMALVLTGCSALPAEERAFAVVLSVEKAEKWAVRARIPTYQSGGGYHTVEGRGETLAQAMSSLDDQAPMRVNFSQLRLLVLSDLGDALLPALYALGNRPDMRLNAAVAVYLEEHVALMEALKPATGSRLSKSLDVLRQTRVEQGSIPAQTLGDILRFGHRQTPVLAALTLQEDAPDLLGGYPVSREGRLTEALTAKEMQLLSLAMDRNAAEWHAVSARLTLQGETAALRLKANADSADDQETLAQNLFTLLTRLTAQGCDPLGVARLALRQGSNMPAPLQWRVSVQLQPPA